MSVKFGKQSPSKKNGSAKKAKSMVNYTERKCIQGSLKNILQSSTFNPENSIEQTIERAIDDDLSHDRKILEKIDFYITPYNKEQHLKESMSFGDKHKFCKTIHEKAQKDWKMISDFVFNSEKKELRTKLNQYNPQLYGSIKKLAFELASKDLNSIPEERRKTRHKSEIHRASELKINVLKAEQESNDHEIDKKFQKGNNSLISPLMKIKRHKENKQKQRHIKRMIKKQDKLSFSTTLDMISDSATKPTCHRSKTIPTKAPTKHMSALNCLQPNTQFDRLTVPRTSNISVGQEHHSNFPSIHTENKAITRVHRPSVSSVNSSSIVNPNILAPVRSSSQKAESANRTPQINHSKSIDVTNSVTTNGIDPTYDDSFVQMGYPNKSGKSSRETKLPLINRRDLTVKRPRKTNSFYVTNKYPSGDTTSEIRKPGISSRGYLDIDKSNLDSDSCSVSITNDANLEQTLPLFREKSINIPTRTRKKALCEMPQTSCHKDYIPLVESSKKDRSKITKKKKNFASPDKENFKRIDPSWIIYNPKGSEKKYIQDKTRAMKIVFSSPTKNSPRTYGVKDARMFL
ncbi:unnamed protein product [Moneuplotes crassus]|uniref:Uncharacterized protein n=1 Tax=Euplotes crassus TaxID=5936 RepID=A0AAD1Y6D1_EUPCR|nr:unnamed protein product [Moneuplotes crassus]